MDNIIIHAVAVVGFAALAVPVAVNAILVTLVSVVVVWAATDVPGLFYAVVATFSREQVTKDRPIAPSGAKIPLKMAADALRYTIKNVN
ncbi:MAG: hypothetical protein GY771_10840 [bacterium]|nr:hypothetical protein [bacterium]